MTRTECEWKILQKLLEINAIYKEYNPDGNYLSLAVTEGNHYCINNAYMQDDLFNQINAWYRPDDYSGKAYGYDYPYSKRTFFDINTGEVIPDAAEP